MLRFRSDPDLSSSKGRNHASDGLGVYLSKTFRHDAASNVNSGIVPVQLGLIVIEIEEKIGRIASREGISEVNGRLLVL